MMDKKSAIGFGLIILILGVFMWMNQPSPQQEQALQRQQDSIRIAAQLKEERIKEQALLEKQQEATLSDSAKSE